MTAQLGSESGIAPGDGIRVEFVARPPGADTVVVFVHGLAGHFLETWGSAGCPGTFLSRLTGDLPQVVVATVGYPSDVDRIRNNGHLTLDSLVRAWTPVLDEAFLRRYRIVAIVGHCLGGLLTTMALRRLLISGGTWPDRLRRGQSRLVVFLLDSPHRLPGRDDEAPAGFHYLKRKLRMEAAAFHANARFWKAKFTQPDPDRIPVDFVAVISKGDNFVTPLCPSADLPEDRVYHAEVSHTELTRPPVQGPFATYDFIFSRLRELLVLPPR